MPRRLLHPTDEQEKAERELRAFLGGSRKRLHDGALSPAAVAASIVRKDRNAMKRLMQSKDWSGASPGVLVALYEHCHQEVYGVAPAELKPDWSAACSAVEELARDEFKGKTERLVPFVRWVWQRERSRCEERATPTRSRIGWRLMFKYRSLLTDWRLAQAEAEQPRSAR